MTLIKKWASQVELCPARDENQSAQCNIQMSVSFLMTWVQVPDEDDWGKLKLKYLNRTEYLKLTLCADQLKVCQALAC